MTIEEIKGMLLGAPYDFLRTNPRLGKNITLLTLGGSHAYGTNVDSSDVDVRGVALNDASDLLGMNSFEQVVDNTTDTTIYSFKKFINLLLNCNPNIIEMLGCLPEHYIHLSDAGQMLLDNKRLFLSQRAAASFGGYANQQLRRLQNALSHDHMPQPESEEYMRQTLERHIKVFESRLEEYGDCGLRLWVGESDRDGFGVETFCDFNTRGYPVRDFTVLLNSLSNIVKDYEKLNGRNRKKDDAHLNKHAMHLVRLYLMCLDILEKGEIITYREAERDMLLEIRNGKYQNEDGTYQQEFFDMVDAYEQRMQYAKKNTDLPPHPDAKRINELVMECNRRTIEGKI